MRIAAYLVMKSRQEITLVHFEASPKGGKRIGGGEAPAYEKYQIHSPNGAAEIEESLWQAHLRFWEHILSSVRRIGHP
jgi:hypothetical protein